MNALNVLCAQLTRDLFAIATLLYGSHLGIISHEVSAYTVRG